MPDRFACNRRITLDCLRPGKLADSPFIEFFNGSPRDKCLNTRRLQPLEDAGKKTESCRYD